MHKALRFYVPPPSGENKCLYGTKEKQLVCESTGRGTSAKLLVKHVCVSNGMKLVACQNKGCILAPAPKISACKEPTSLYQETGFRYGSMSECITASKSQKVESTDLCKTLDYDPTGGAKYNCVQITPVQVDKSDSMVNY
jgi:hypothetical protein